MANNNNWPTGAVTFLFSDIEHSTPLWDRHRAAMRPALAEHDRILQTAVIDNGGVIVKTTGDGAMAAFASPSQALTAAIAAQRWLQEATWPTIAPDKIRVRMGLHTGEAELRAGDYFGTAVNRAARLMAIGHGAQLLLSGTTRTLVQSNLPGGIELLDLGEHRLRGLSEPAHVYQVRANFLPDAFPALRTGETQKGNLPRPLTNFVGREQELANIKQLLNSNRLLTLTGPGGTGKTRLTLEAGRHLESVYDHGVWLVELAPLNDGSLIPGTIAALFDLHEQAGLAIMESLTNYLRGKNLLLILDNCEHLVAACASLAADLLPAAPRLTILASSREGLGVPGETTMHIPALGIPTRDIVDRDELARFEAVRLFVSRARAARAGFELTEANAKAVGQIVRRLDGIPLALELAAARVKLLSPAQIAARLDDRFRLLTGGSRTALPRQQTLRALIDWSYDLLNEEERWFLRQMSVFSGGWTLEAAEYVVGEAVLESGFLPDQAAGGAQPLKTRFLDPLDLLANLVNKSLVRIDDADVPSVGDEMRYLYLETIRQYALDRLYEAGESAHARDRHFAYFQQQAGEPFEDDIVALSNDQARLEHELDNLRAALDWGAGQDPVAAIALLHSLAPLWSMLGLGGELRRRAELLLEDVEQLPPAAFSRRARAFGLNTLAQGGALTGGDEKAYEAAEQAAVLFRDEGSLPVQLASSLFWQSVLGVEINRPQGYAAAQECYEISQKINNHLLQHLALIVLARWEVLNGDTAAAAAHLVEASRLHTKVRNPVLIAYQAYAESMVNRLNGDFDKAQQVLAWGVAALQQAQHRLFANILDSELGHTLRQGGDLAGAVDIYRHTIEEWLDLGNRAAVANQLECFAFLAIAEGADVRAARLLGAAEVLRETLSNTMMPAEREEYDLNVTSLKGALDEDALETAWQDGRALDMETAVKLAIKKREDNDF